MSINTRFQHREHLRQYLALGIRSNLLSWDIASDEDFKTFLSCGYEGAKRAVVDLTENGVLLEEVVNQMPEIVGKVKYVRLRDGGRSEMHAQEDFLVGLKPCLFAYALGLFEFGRLDIVYDILDNIPGTANPRARIWIREQVLCLIWFIVVPHTINPLHDPEPMHKWLQANAAHLKWNEEQLFYDWVASS